ncbi:hypothetical protein D3C76_658790 [compost metagenome]
MPTVQYSSRCKVYLHPTTCTRPAIVEAFQRSTGLQLIVSPTGHVRAVPNGGAA